MLTLDNLARPQHSSVSSAGSRQDMRPGHRGRILKDTGRPDRLSPLTNENIVNGKSNLTIEAKSEHSFRRLRDLEAENEKLKRNLHEAESSIRSYKTFIVARPSRHFVDAQVQTTQTSTSSTDMTDAHRQLEIAHQKLNQQCLNLRNQIDSQSRFMSDSKAQHSAAMQQKQAELDEANDKIAALQAAAAFTTPAIVPEDFREGAAALKAEYTHFSSHVRNELSDYASYMVTCHEQLCSKINELQQQNTALQMRLAQQHALSKADSIRMSSKVDSASSPIAPPMQRDPVTPVKPPPTPVTPYRTPRTTACNSPIESGVSVGTDPMTTLQEYLQQIHLIDSLKQQVAAHPAQIDKQLNALSSRHQLEKQNLLHAVSSATNNANSLKTKVSAAMALLLKYQAKVDSLVKSVRHEAHCADLVKVASLREANIERDRLASELKHAKYVIDI